MRKLSFFALTLLAIEFLDEFVFGAREAAWPLIRDDLALTYAQIGLLLGIPGVIASLIEPLLGILGDVWRRRVLVLGGGVVFTVALLLTAGSSTFVLLLLSFILLYPASGAFVSLSQATLMDLDPARREHNMARWTFAGSLGVVAGPLALGAQPCLGWAGAGFAGRLRRPVAGVAGVAWRMPYPDGAHSEADAAERLRRACGGAARAAARRSPALAGVARVLRPDAGRAVGLPGALFRGCGRRDPGSGGGAVAVWTGVGLLGDLLLIPLLERVRGLSYLRVSVVARAGPVPGLLAGRRLVGQVRVGGLLGLFNSGWYSILQAGLYSAMPGRSGTALAVTTCPAWSAG